jgi:hypothetical protein
MELGYLPCRSLITEFQRMQVGENRNCQCTTITSWHNHPITRFSCALTHIVYVCDDLLEKAALEILKRPRLMGWNSLLAHGILIVIPFRESIVRQVVRAVTVSNEGPDPALNSSGVN